MGAPRRHVRRWHGLAFVAVLILTGCGGGSPSGEAPTGQPVASEGDAGADSSPAGDSGEESTPSAGEKSEIVLGSFGFRSGVQGASLRGVVAAIEAWEQDVNARGGLNGHPVRVIHEDDTGDPARANEIVRRLVEEENVTAMFGLTATNTFESVRGYLEEQGVPVVNAGSAVPTEDISPVVFNPGIGADLGISRSYLGSLYAANPDIETIGIVHCTESQTCVNGAERVSQFADVLGIEVVGVYPVSLSAPEYTATVLAAQRDGAEGLITYMATQKIAQLISDAHQQGYEPLIGAGISGFKQQFIDAGGEELVGTLAAASVAPSFSDLMAPYREAVEQYTDGGDIDNNGAQAWAGGKMLEVVADEFDDDVSREELAELLRGLKGSTLDGLVSPLAGGGFEGENPQPEDASMCFVPIALSSPDEFAAPQGASTYLCAREDGFEELDATQEAG